jgi:hypothetical protein
MADEPEIVAGKRGDEGYLNVEEKETLKEIAPDLAPYASLKFKTVDPEEEASEHTKALGATTEALLEAGEEIERLKKQADDRELSGGVESLLDQVEEVAEQADLSWEERERFNLAWQQEALQHAVGIEDDELRERTLKRLEERVDPDLYEAFAEQWQGAWVAQEEQEMQSALEREQPKPRSSCRPSPPSSS